jgi:hypothetical protein
MDEKDQLIHIIYLRNDSIILSKKKYTNWHEIQDEFDNYMTSIGPWTSDDIIEYIEMENGDESNWGFSRKEILSFSKSTKLLIRNG